MKSTLSASICERCARRALILTSTTSLTSTIVSGAPNAMRKSAFGFCGSRRPVRDHAVRELDAGLGPLRDRPSHPKFGVVGVGVDGHRALYVERLVEPHCLSVRERRTVNASPPLRRCDVPGGGILSARTGR